MSRQNKILDYEGFDRGRLVIERNGQTILDRTFDVDDIVVQPNGPDCEPTCHIALVDLKTR